MPFTPPPGVTPVDRKPPSAPTFADIPAVLDWLRGYYGGHTVIGLLITDRATGSTYRVDAESTYSAFVQGGPYGTYTLTLAVGRTVINAADYARFKPSGVIGDGTDDRPVLQAALAAAGVQAALGQAVLLTLGQGLTYNLLTYSASDANSLLTVGSYSTPLDLIIDGQGSWIKTPLYTTVVNGFTQTLTWAGAGRLRITRTKFKNTHAPCDGDTIAVYAMGGSSNGLARLELEANEYWNHSRSVQLSGVQSGFSARNLYRYENGKGSGTINERPNVGIWGLCNTSGLVTNFEIVGDDWRGSEITDFSSDVTNPGLTKRPMDGFIFGSWGGLNAHNNRVFRHAVEAIFTERSTQSSVLSGNYIHDNMIDDAVGGLTNASPKWTTYGVRCEQPGSTIRANDIISTGVPILINGNDTLATAIVGTNVLSNNITLNGTDSMRITNAGWIAALKLQKGSIRGNVITVKGAFIGLDKTSTAQTYPAIWAYLADGTFIDGNTVMLEGSPTNGAVVGLRVQGLSPVLGINTFANCSSPLEITQAASFSLPPQRVSGSPEPTLNSQTVSAGGVTSEQMSLDFTPTAGNVGWHRIGYATGLLAATLEVSSAQYDNRIASSIFDINYAGYGLGGTVTQRTQSAYNAGLISQVRVSAAGNGATVALDVYIASATAPGKINFKLINFGKQAGTRLIKPLFSITDPVSGDTPVILASAPGLNTTGGATVGGAVVAGGNLMAQGLIPKVVANRSSGTGFGYMSFTDGGSQSRAWRMNYGTQAMELTNTSDTVLAYFDSAGSVISNGYLYSKTGFVTVPSSGQTIAAGTAINPNATFLQLNPNSGTTTITATPSITTTGKSDGTHLTLLNYQSTGYFTLQDNSVLAGSAVYLGGLPSITLYPRQVAEFIYSAAVAGWVLKSRSNARLVATATLDFPSTAAQGQQELTISVTGAAVGDTVSLSRPAALEAGLITTARVTAANTVSVRCSNITAAAIDPAAASYTVLLHK